MKTQYRLLVWTAIAGAALVFGSIAFAGSGWVQEGVKVRLETGDDRIILAPITHRNLSIFPIRRPATREPSDAGRYISLDEGLKSGLVEVHELGELNPPPLVRPRPPAPDEPQVAGRPAQRGAVQMVQAQTTGPDVNRLMIVNKSDRKLLLLAGEMVVGGKQDRIVQKDRIVPPSEKPTIVDVFCVEQGRWSGGANQFSAASLPASAGGGFGGGIADPAVRGTAQASGKQVEVWDEVGKKNRSAGVQTGTTTYQAARMIVGTKGQDKPYLDALEKKVSGPEVVGAIVAVNGKLIWLDEFSSPTLFAKYWPKLLRSYVMEAIAARPTPDLESRMIWKVPTPEQAATYRMDRTGSAKFEGEEGIYKLLRIDGKAHVIYELTDLERKDSRTLHVCKMERK